MSKKTKTLKRLSDKDLAKLVGGFKDSRKAQAGRAQAGRAQAMSASGSTWLHDCWEGVCTAYAKSQALQKGSPAEKQMLQNSEPVESENPRKGRSY